MIFSLFWKKEKKQEYKKSVLEKYPDKDWNYRYLARNHNISMGFIEEHIDKFNIDDVFNDYILSNPNLTFNFVKKYKKYFIKYQKNGIYSLHTFTKLIELFGVDRIYNLFDLHNDIYFTPLLI